MCKSSMKFDLTLPGDDDFKVQNVEMKSFAAEAAAPASKNKICIRWSVILAAFRTDSHLIYADIH